ncbi:flagellar biosynthetic protein FliR [Glacieibacterium sp.]|uniref:flagellar biosynthetic protein FliR n=1 Tax=Glacieibacterium sp. TaxID=2860237 RepID=UPI003B005956
MISAWLASPERELWRLIFASLRAAAALLLLPGIGSALLPIRVRTGLALMLGMVALAAGVVTVPEVAAMPGAVLGEVLIGLGIGVIVQCVFAAASVAGEVISQAMGMGFATMVGAGGGTSPVLTNFLSLLMWLAFVGVDGHARLFACIVESYRSLPPGASIDALRVAEFGAFAFGTGLMLALPVTGVVLLVNLWLAVLARSAPQLNLFSIGFAVLMVTGLLALPLALPAMLATMSEAAADGQAELAQVILSD